jgi:hypothetical protein
VSAQTATDGHAQLPELFKREAVKIGAAEFVASNGLPVGSLSAGNHVDMTATFAGV